jgi:hypothetical protein
VLRKTSTRLRRSIFSGKSIDWLRIQSPSIECAGGGLPRVQYHLRQEPLELKEQARAAPL